MAKTNEKILAYHFVGEKLRDGRPIPPIGFKLVHPGEPVPCVRGLHASLHPFDALQYAPGNILCLVKLGGIIIPHNDNKVVAQERTIIASFDAEPLLRKFAKLQALSVMDKWKAPQVVIDYLNSDTEELRPAARDAAWDAARHAARDSAGAAARHAAWSAAGAAAWDAARGAAKAAARDAAWSAAREAARAVNRQMFKDMVDSKFQSIGAQSCFSY